MIRIVLRLTGCLLLLAAGSLILMAIWQMRHGWQILSVQTGSMSPVIAAGDAVVVRPARDAPRLGNIVTYRTVSQTPRRITHRVIGVTVATGLITTKGDAVAEADTPISRRQIEGSVVRIIPHAGSFVDFSRSLTGLALLVYLPAAVIVGFEIRRLYGKGQRHYKSI